MDPSGKLGIDLLPAVLEGNPTPTAKILGSQGLHQDRESYIQRTTEIWMISKSILYSSTVSNPDVSESSSKKDVRTASNPAYVQSTASKDIGGQHLLVWKESTLTQTNLHDKFICKPNIRQSKPKSSSNTVPFLTILAKKATRNVPSLNTSPRQLQSHHPGYSGRETLDASKKENPTSQTSKP